MTTALVERKFNIPPTLIDRFGCVNCRLRDSCDYVKEGRMPEEGICDEQKVWLLSNIPHYTEKPTLERVMLDFTKSITHGRHVKEEFELKRLEKELAKAVSEEEKGKIKREFSRVWERWSRTSRTLLHFEDLAVTRQMPTKFEVTKTFYNPNEIYEMRKKARKIIDVEFEVKEEGEEEDVK